jgi:hypothetical protein
MHHIPENSFSSQRSSRNLSFDENTPKINLDLKQDKVQNNHIFKDIQL